MATQILRDCRVAINRGGTYYPLNSLGNVSLSSSIQEVTVDRKTLFNNTSIPHIVTSKVNPTTISMTIVLDKSTSSNILLELIGLHGNSGTYELPNHNTATPELFELVITNSESVIKASPCYLESIDISLTKQDAISIECSVSTANIKMLEARNPITSTCYTALPISPVHYSIGSDTVNTIKSASISIQQVASWLDGRTLFESGNTIYTHSSAVLEDRIVSANATMTYTGDKINLATDNDVQLGKSGFILSIENARITHNLDLESIYSIRHDISISSNTGIVLFTLEI